MNDDQPDIDRADIDGADIDGADIDGADIDGAGIDGAGIDGAGIDGANIDGAGIDGAGIDRAGTDGAEVDRAVLGLAALIVAGDTYRFAAARRFGLGVVDSYAISYLDTYGPLHQNRLASLMALSGGAITGVVDRLERSDTARRTSDPRDRRRNRVELTDKARQILADSRVGLARALHDLDPDEIAALTALLPRLADSINREARHLADPGPPSDQDPAGTAQTD